MLYANSISLPALLQSLFGYDATTSGLVLSPSGIFAVVMLFIVGAMLSRGIDARYLMAGGLLTMALGSYWMARLNLDVSPWQVVWPRVLVIAGLSMLFAPLNVAAFIYLPKEIRGPAVGLLALLRNEGGSVGTSVAQIIQERREQFHTLRLNESLDTLNPAVNNLLTRGQAFFLQHNGDAVLSHQMAAGVLDQSLARQASSLAYFDVFSLSAAVGVVLGIFYPAHAPIGSGAGRPHWWRVASSRRRRPIMDKSESTTRQKALAINLDATTYGTFAEIGGGQEVARWFFLVGGAAGTVAKTISAYDMSVSDSLYGPAKRYVSRERLEAMLRLEFAQLLERLDPSRGEAKSSSPSPTPWRPPATGSPAKDVAGSGFDFSPVLARNRPASSFMLTCWTQPPRTNRTRSACLAST